MNNLLFKFIGVLVSFFLIWFLLSQIDWMSIFQVNENTSKTEEKIGELYIEMIQLEENIIVLDSLIDPIVAIVDQIKEANNISTHIKLHLVEKDEVNAFAIPDDHLILYSGLVIECQSPEELAGVIGHEIAHMEKNHVMKKLVKEVGLSVLISMASGNNGTLIQETFKTLTSSAYDRKLETEADLTSIDYLKKADIDFRPFATFLFRLSLDESNLEQSLQLLNSHPASEERAKAILGDNENNNDYGRPIMADQNWELLKKAFVDHLNE